MLHVPVRLAHSQLHLNRADFPLLFAKSEKSFSESVSVRSGSSVLPDVKVIPADADRLDLTPHDAAGLKIDPETIIVERSADFLKMNITLEHSGREIQFLGKLWLIPRRLYLNSANVDELKLQKGQSVFVAANTPRATIFGDVKIHESNGTSYFILSREEAESALLKENDLVHVVARSGPGGEESQYQLSPKLPERFLQIDLTLKGKTKFILITETHVWQAIRMRKKIWVPKNARLTQAARDLGTSRKLLEYEL